VDTYVIALWILLGFALSTWFMMHIWLPDPPPNIVGSYVGILVAGAVGAVAGGFLGSRASGEVMVGAIAAAAGGLFLAGAVGFLTGAGRSATP
jgi:hypothetical protein